MALPGSEDLNNISQAVKLDAITYSESAQNALYVAHCLKFSLVAELVPCIHVFNICQSEEAVRALSLNTQRLSVLPA